MAHVQETLQRVRDYLQLRNTGKGDDAWLEHTGVQAYEDSCFWSDMFKIMFLEQMHTSMDDLLFFVVKDKKPVGRNRFILSPFITNS